MNTDGLVGFDRTHEFKAFAGYQIPKVEISANMFFRMLSGVPWTPFTRIAATSSNNILNYTTSTDLALEPRGSRRTGCWYPSGLASETGCGMQKIFDLRLEKVFNVGANRLGLYMDAENLFNSAFPTSVQTRYPSGSVNYIGPPDAQFPAGRPTSTVVLMGNPLTINVARQITFGGRWSF